MELQNLPPIITNNSPIAGWHVKACSIKSSTRQDRAGEHALLLIDLKKGDEHETIGLWIPAPTKDNVVHLDSSFYAIRRIGIPEPTYWMNRRDLRHVRFLTQEEVVGRMILNTLRSCLSRGQLVDVQAMFDKTIRNSEFCVVVRPWKKLEMESEASTVLLLTETGNDILKYIPTNWRGSLDILTTPTSEKVGKVFRLTDGTVIRDRKIRGSGSLFNSVLKRNLLFPENTRPYRLIIMRSPICRHEKLLDGEDPWVCHESYREGDLSGKHLRTAVTHTAYTSSDSIAVSQSAANKLTCYRRKTQVVLSRYPSSPMAFIGDMVQPGGELAVVFEDGDFQSPSIVRAKTIHRASKVVDIIQVPSHIGGLEATKMLFVLEAEYPMMDGDKITTRHGGKGVVRIIPDAEMPHDSEGQAVDICIHPRSIFARRAYGTLREMMVNRMVQDNVEAAHITIRVKHFGDAYSFEEMARSKYGENTQLYHMGRKLEHTTFVAPLFWIRTDKHSVEAMASVGFDKPINANGLSVNTGKHSGQKMTVGMGSVMIGKGLEKTYLRILDENIEDEAIAQSEEIISCLNHSNSSEPSHETSSSSSQAHGQSTTSGGTDAQSATHSARIASTSSSDASP